MNIQKATFGNGCFWCTEAIFKSIIGVISAKSGYMGGHTLNPTYIEVCNGDTGHAEVIQIEFDGDKVTYSELLIIFFKTHNPTTLNQQGNDIGTQYRSVIFYHDNNQKADAIAMIHKLTAENIFDKPIVTEITKAPEFYIAEQYHQNYYRENTNKSYCQVVIQPKMIKLAKEFRDKIKPEFL